MKTPLILATVTTAALLIGCLTHERVYAAANSNSSQRYEYATIRWGGRENTCVIRPGANVEMVGAELGRLKRPDRVDERSFYMNAVLNGLAKEGYEFAGMTPDEIILKRPVSQ